MSRQKYEELKNDAIHTVMDKYMLRTGTAEPYGWVKNTFSNRFVQRCGGYHDYDKPFIYALWRLFTFYCIMRPYNITKNKLMGWYDE